MADLAAVILAAGLSSRMDRFKPLAPLGDATMIEQVVRTFVTASIKNVLVVTGHHGDELAAVVRRTGARPVHNPKFLDGMFTSVQAGVEALPQDTSGFFLLPVDLPLVRYQTLARLAGAFKADTADVIHPLFSGFRGHPPLLSSRLCPLITAGSGKGGLRALLETFALENPGQVQEVPVPDHGILQDIDTEEEYRNVLKRWPQRDLPSREECEAIMDIAKTPIRARLHGQTVARVAVAMGREINTLGINGPILDLELIDRAGLVHDLAKGHPAHEQEGGRMLQEAGFTDTARIVSAHRDLNPVPGSPVTETEVVFLADKVVAGTDIVPLVQRYEAVLERHGADPEARRAIHGRRERAKQVLHRVEHVMNRSLTKLAAEALDKG